MKQRSSAVCLTIFIGDADTWCNKNVAHEIVRRALTSGLDGATVFRGQEGFGASSLVHTADILSLADDLPVVIIIIDTERKVRNFLPQIEELVIEGVMTLEPCELIRYSQRARSG